MRTTLSVIQVVLRLAVGGLFVWAATAKLGAPHLFLDSVKAFRILPEHLLIPTTFVLPWIELVCGAALILGLWTRAAALATTGLMLTFIAVVISGIKRGLDLECSCFGEQKLFCEKVDWCKVYENIVITGAAVLVLLLGGGRYSLDGLLGGARAAKPDRLAE